MTAAAPLDLLATGAAAWQASSRARVLVVGPDARALLHRLSTNHVSGLAAGEGRLNALLTDKGRLVDLVHHLDRGDAGVLLVGSPGRGPALLTWLDRYLFSEQVELADVSGVGSCAQIAGVHAAAIVDTLVPGAAALGRWGFVERAGRLVARGFDCAPAPGAGAPSFVVIDLERPAVLGALSAGGATIIDDVGAEAVRIAAGVPGPSGEIVEAYHPLELALHDAIHWAKGCYIGQEVIARLDSYSKVGKRLIGVVLDDHARARLVPGAALLVGGKQAGVITSVSPSWNGALPSALAMVAVASAEEAAEVQLPGGTAAATPVARSAEQRPHA